MIQVGLEQRNDMNQLISKRTILTVCVNKRLWGQGQKQGRPVRPVENEATIIVQTKDDWHAPCGSGEQGEEWSDI